MLKQDTIINGRYHITRVLGTGGMGSVYAATDTRLGRNVALKILRADLAQDPRARERFLREAQIAAQLIHPGIVRTYDVGDAPEGPYLVQELLDGATLDTRVPLPPQEAVAVIAGVADALSYIHGQGYVHCDIKPQNIMLVANPAAPSAAPRAVLLDFGIARVQGTETTTLIATPHYLAPERAMGAAPTASSDLYALGIVLYQTLAAHPPFDGQSVHSIIMQHQTAPVPPLNINLPEAPALETIIQKLAAKQPEQRYASAAELSRDLLNVATHAQHNQPTVVVNPVQQGTPLVAASPVQPASTPPAPVRRTPAAVPPPPPAQPAVGAAPQPTPLLRRRWLFAVPLLLGALLVGGALVRDRDRGATPTNAARPTSVQQPSNAARPANVEVPAASTPAVVNVPAVIGLPVEQARQQIESAGLKFTLGDAVQSDQPVGNVAQTAPLPEQPVAPGSEVVVQSSSGQPVAAPPPADDEEKKDEEKKDEEKKDEEKKDEGKGKGKDKKK